MSYISSAVVVVLFLARLWFTGAIINGPNFHPKVDFGGPNYKLQASHVASDVDWPGRTLLTVRPARQDGVLQRRMTTTALVISSYMTTVLNTLW